MRLQAYRIYGFSLLYCCDLLMCEVAFETWMGEFDCDYHWFLTAECGNNVLRIPSDDWWEHDYLESRRKVQKVGLV